MKLIKAEDMKEIDRRATSEYGIPSLVLMENAGIRTVEMAQEMLPFIAGKKIIILTGRGNNGGDGLVAARHLYNHGADPVVFIMGDPGQLSPDGRVNHGILQKLTHKIYPLTEAEHREKLILEMLGAELVIDALFGIGFKGSLDDLTASVAHIVNKSKIPVLAVDIPSGVEADSGHVNGEAFQATATITFALPKPGLILEPGRHYAGRLKVADISIPPALLQDQRLPMNLITADMVAGMLGPRDPESHKGTFGHAILIGGSTGMSGAILLASRGAIRCGAGLVSAALPESLVPVFDTASQEVMSIPMAQTRQGAIAVEALPAIENILGTASVCAIGPGMSRYKEANAIVRFVLERAGIPVVIDADGLNALEEDVSILKERQIPVVLTPHPGEMARLTGKTIDEVQSDRIHYATYYAREWGVTIVLKGNKTLIAAPNGDVYVNTTGNPGMATAGSGDVLCGIITGLISQGLKPVQASVAGVYLHGLSGDHVTETRGQRGLIASDLLEALPCVMVPFEKES